MYYFTLMQRYNISIMLSILLLPVILTGTNDEYEFKWNFQVNKTFTIDKFTAQTITKNGVAVRKREIRDFIIIVPQKKRKKMFPLTGSYYSYQRPVGSKGPFELIESYMLDEKGRIVVRSGQLGTESDIKTTDAGLQLEMFPVVEVVQAIRNSESGVFEQPGKNKTSTFIVFYQMRSLGWYYVEKVDRGEILK